MQKGHDLPIISAGEANETVEQQRLPVWSRVGLAAAGALVVTAGLASVAVASDDGDDTPGEDTAGTAVSAMTAGPATAATANTAMSPNSALTGVTAATVATPQVVATAATSGSPVSAAGVQVVNQVVDDGTAITSGTGLGYFFHNANTAALGRLASLLGGGVTAADLQGMKVGEVLRLARAQGLQPQDVTNALAGFDVAGAQTGGSDDTSTTAASPKTVSPQTAGTGSTAPTGLGGRGR